MVQSDFGVGYASDAPVICIRVSLPESGSAHTSELTVIHTALHVISQKDQLSPVMCCDSCSAVSSVSQYTYIYMFPPSFIGIDFLTSLVSHAENIN